MQKTLSINTHTADANTAADVERRHYTVAQLIAELNNYDGDTEIVIKDLGTGKYGSISFQGISDVKSEPQA